MTDRELLELAAKTVGKSNLIEKYGVWYADGYPFNPLTDDGDALRLAVKLGISVYVECAFHGGFTEAEVQIGDEYERNTVMHNEDPYTATRRAIVRAAAEIGKENEQ